MNRLFTFTGYILLFVPLLLNGQSAKDSLQQALTAHYEQSDLPGFAVAIVDQEEVLYQEAFGYADTAAKKPFSTETILNLGSVSKAVVGLALVKAVYEDLLTLDDPIFKWLPFSVINPNFKETPILIRHLANHTSSITDSKYYSNTYIQESSLPGKPTDDAGFAKFLEGHEVYSQVVFLSNILSKGGDWYKKKHFLKSAPGTVQSYANLNAALAGLIVELACGKPFEQFTDRYIFTPLDMVSTGWTVKSTEKLATRYFPRGSTVPPYRLITYPDGGLYSNLKDMSNLLMEMIKAFDLNSPYLPPDYAEMLFPGNDADDRAFWGMGEESRNIGHGGSDPGVQTDLQFNADRKVGRIILCNVNAEDNEALWQQYRKIHQILASYEDRLK